MTSDFHIARSQAIFEKCFRLANAAYGHCGTQLQLTSLAAPDDHTMTEEVLLVRSAKEAKALKVLTAMLADQPSDKMLIPGFNRSGGCRS